MKTVNRAELWSCPALGSSPSLPLLSRVTLNKLLNPSGPGYLSGDNDLKSKGRMKATHEGAECMMGTQGALSHSVTCPSCLAPDHRRQNGHIQALLYLLDDLAEGTP